MRSAFFTVPAAPRGKGRPRVTRGGRHSYTPDATAAFESVVALAAAGAMGSRWEGPVFVTIWAVFPRPKRLRRKADPAGLVKHPVKPDADNVAKAVLDGLAAWFDDAQVTDLTVRKRYAELDGAPRVEVEVTEVSDVAP